MGTTRPTMCSVAAGLMLMGAAAVTPAFAKTGVGMVGARAGSVVVIDVNDDEHRHVYLVRRPIVEPASVVDRGLSEQPVHEHLMELSIAHVRVLADPDLNYQVKPEGELDDNHSLLAAQREYKAERHAGVKSLRAMRTDAAASSHPRPSMILTKPAAPAVPRFVPEAPAPQKATPRLMAAK